MRRRYRRQHLGCIVVLQAATDFRYGCKLVVSMPREYSLYFIIMYDIPTIFDQHTCMTRYIFNWKMLKAQLKSNFGPTFLLSLKKKKKTDVEERENEKFSLKVGLKLDISCAYIKPLFNYAHMYLVHIYMHILICSSRVCQKTILPLFVLHCRSAEHASKWQCESCSFYHRCYWGEDWFSSFSSYFVVANYLMLELGHRILRLS